MLVTLPLYILRELGKALGMSLLIISFLFLALAAGTALRDGASIFTVISLMPRFFPLVSPMVLPFSIITGTLICYGRLSGTNEYIATQAGGVHPLWVASPALAVAFLASVITVYLNANVLTAATVSIEKALVRDKTEIIRRQLSRPGSFTFNNFAACRLEEGGIDLTFFTMPKDDDKDKNEAGVNNRHWDPAYPVQVGRIIAQDHSIKLHEDDKKRLIVQVNLKQFQEFHIRDKEMQTVSAKEGTRNLPATSENTEFKISSKRLTYWGIGELIKGRRKLREDIRKAMESHDRIRDPNSPAKKEWARYAGILRRSFYKQTAELNLKLALSFACVAFAFVGAPLGLLGRNTSKTIGYAYGTGVALAYFVIEKGLQTQVRDGRIGATWMWLPNLVLICLGVWLWLRCNRRD